MFFLIQLAKHYLNLLKVGLSLNMELIDSARIAGQQIPVVDSVWGLINEVDI